MLESGQRVRHYVVNDTIARTKMSTVYHAVDEELGREVALKELGGALVDDPTFVERFRKEARIAATIPVHPNIVAIYEYFVHGVTPYIAMEYCRLGDLSEVQDRLDLPQVMTVMADVLAALSVAEEHGIVNRDLKPANLLRTHQGSVKVTDFGIAKAYLTTDPSSLTADGQFHGSPLYVAPEIALGQEAGPSADLYSLGVIAYQLLTGTVPFQDSPNEIAAVIRKTREEHVPLAHARPDLDIGLTRWVDRLLRRQPERRFPSAKEASDALESARSAAGITRAPLPTRDEPSPAAPEPQAIARGFASLHELERTEGRGRLALNAATRGTTVLVVGAVVVCAILVSSWLIWVALGAWIALALLTFFDMDEALRVRRRHRRRPHGRHAA